MRRTLNGKQETFSAMSKACYHPVTSPFSSVSLDSPKPSSPDDTDQKCRHHYIAAVPVLIIVQLYHVLSNFSMSVCPFVHHVMLIMQRVYLPLNSHLTLFVSCHLS